MVMGRYLKFLPLSEQQRSQSVRGQQELSSTVWVQLAALPNPYSHDQALLICRHSEDEWLAWIPDHGEAILHRSEFYFESDWN